MNEIEHAKWKKEMKKLFKDIDALGINMELKRSDYEAFYNKKEIEELGGKEIWEWIDMRTELEMIQGDPSFEAKKIETLGVIQSHIDQLVEQRERLLLDVPF